MCNLQKAHWEGSRSITENMIQQNRPALPPSAILTVPKGMREQTPLVLQWTGGHEDRLVCPVLAPWCTGFQCAVRKFCRSSWWHLGFRQEQLILLRSHDCCEPNSALSFTIDSNEVMFPKWRSQWMHKTTSLCNSNHSITPHHTKDSVWHSIHNLMEVVVGPA